MGNTLPVPPQTPRPVGGGAAERAATRDTTATAALAHLRSRARLRSRPVARVLRRRLALGGLLLGGAVAIATITAPLVAPHDPLAQEIALRLHPPTFRSPEGAHLLGTDHLGRDVLSRILYGGRVSLLISGLSVLLAGIIGLAAGLVAGYYRGLAESVVMRLVEIQLAFPLILLALAIVVSLGATVLNTVLVFALTSWPVYAAIIRGEVLTLARREFVLAARAVGAGDMRTLARHLLPNLVSPLTVVASFEFARLILMEAAIGFLGLGIQPPTPSWGNLLADGRAYIQDAWWLTAFPGVTIALTVSSINFIGDALRDVFDPRLVSTH
jgi:peptide/nickel transport system permease protein